MKKIDELVKRVEFFERLAVYGDRKSFLKRIAQEASYQGFEGSTMVGDSGNPPPAPADWGTAKETVITANPPVSKKVQEMLNQLLAVQRTEMVPMPVDGELGPKTREAFKTFQRVFGKPGTPEAVAQVYNQQKQKNQIVDLDDAAKQRDEYYKSQSIPPGMPGSRT